MSVVHELPRDVALEREVLGAALLDPRCWDAAREHLNGETGFSDHEHKAMWDAAVALESRGERPDAVGVMGALQGRQGAAQAVERVTSVAIPSALVVAERARKLALVFAQRRMCITAGLIQAEGREGVEDIGDYLARSVAAVTEVADSRPGTAGSVTLGESLERAWAGLESRRAMGDSLLGLRTGLTKLDEALAGLQPGLQYIVCGRPGMGKSGFAQRLVREVAEHRPAVVFSLEMPADQWSLRWLSSESGVPGDTLRKLRWSGADSVAIARAREALGVLPVEIVDEPCTMFDVRQHARRVKRERGDLGLVVIDYLQLLRSERRENSREREVSEMSRAGKQLAKELGVPLVMLCQLNRGPENRPRNEQHPKLADLRESGSIEQDADVVLGLYRDAYYNAKSEDAHVCEVVVLKQREGPTGRIRLRFDGATLRFDNLQEWGGEHGE